ncbi:MAG TPA: DUF2809 domain-containing protein [Kofleriaceae bacterium]
MRSRLVYVLAVALTIAAGLGSRAIHGPKEIGDALYATMVCFAIRVLVPRARMSIVAAAALAFSFAIEFSQAVHRPWLDDLRATLPGRLVLGQGFHALDLLAYVCGVALAVALDRGLTRLARGGSDQA